MKRFDLKTLTVILGIAIVGLFTLGASWESSSYNADPVVLYGYNGTSIVKLLLNSTGALVTNAKTLLSATSPIAYNNTTGVFTFSGNTTGWDTASNQTRQWDGGATGLNATTGKTSLGINNVTNNAQVKGLSAGTTTGHLVTWGADGYTVADGGVVSSSGLGARVDKTTSHGAQQATTDGFVKAFGYSSGGVLHIYGFTDNTSDPTTVADKSTNIVNSWTSIGFFVNKNNYWNVTSDGAAPTVLNVTWTPIGN